MSVQFSGWEVVSDRASSPGVELGPSQKPQKRGIYTMYHGTSTASARLIIANGFKQSSGGMLGKGVYVSRDKKKAAHYPLNSQITDRVVLELRVRPGRVKRIDQDNHPMQLSWHANGYDTAWVPPNCGLKAVPSGLEEDCVFDPKRVEVVTYDDDSPRVELASSQEPKDRGVYTMYHGTSVANARLIIANGFKQSSGGMLGKGVYVSRDKKKAERYPLDNNPSDRVALELRVRVGRVKRIDKDNHPMQYTWSTQGYDTAWVPPNCGMKAVPSGLQEDCVFDPKRIEVVGIAKAPNNILAELQQLVANRLRDPSRRDGALDVCSLCKRKTQQGSPHIKQQMSVTFFGWEVTYDDDSPRVELASSQEPKDRGVYTMYHGTSVANARLIIANGFKQSSGGMLGKGVYVSRDKKKAERYPLDNNPSDRVALELRVRVGRVKRIDKDNHPMQYTWSTQGYDTAWVPPNCGMKAVPSGLQEDCVFDPKRIEVVGIAKAPNNILAELQQLVANRLRDPSRRDGALDVCSLCKRKTQQGSPHIKQQCWGCGQNICPLMIKHVCPVNDLQNRMSVTFFGWEVTYDDDSPRVELASSQEPKDRGVYTMYHGTSVANARLIIANGFKQSSGGMLGKGVYVSRDKKKAERYPLDNNPSDRVALELRVRVGCVKRIDKDNHPMQYTWSTQGYDTAWVPPNCGMKAVPSGLQEDCVFDPKRIEVVGIAKAPNNILAELQQLVANRLRDPSRRDGALDVCSLCKRKTQQGSPHIKQQCWGCGQNICPLMIKHVCPVNV
ncbi:grass carp reovirus (GCRV)-induced gene 2e [Chelmon rostratus]|uniref:grass carp reovirus (GCRV)-induced gene 2e n=1 Tax=Chelmon rostratus TaxID=109905 RepID=UPI001BEA2FFB|nr:grass carp reovirus (GCRV)-induced gene 2e [Chelmon rostratus]